MKMIPNYAVNAFVVAMMVKCNVVGNSHENSSVAVLFINIDYNFEEVIIRL